MGQSILWIQLLTKYIQGKLESIWTTSYFIFFHINIQTVFEPEFLRISPESSVELGLGEIGGKFYFWRQIRKIKIQVELEIKERGNNGYIKIAVTLFVLSVQVSMTGYIFFYHTFGIIINYKLTQKELMSTTDIYYPHRQFYLDHQSNIYASYQQIYPAPHQSILPHVDSNTLLMANSGKSAGSNNKVKTSLCKKWAEFGTCPYLHKCQFAHGIQQLRCNVDENSYKTKHCNAFFKKGYCPYGFRCNFSHKQAQGAEDETRKIQKQTILGYREILKVAAKQEGKSRLYQSFAQKLDESDSKSISSTEDCRSESLSKSRLGYMEEKIDDSGLNFTEFSVSLLFQPALASASTAEGEEDNTIDANKGLLYFNIDQFC